MSLDDRLSGSLHGAAADVRPDVEHHLARVRERSRHRAPFGEPSIAASATVVVVAVAVVIVLLRTAAADPSALLGTIDMPTQAGAVDDPVTARDPAGALAGRYHARIDGSAPDGSTAAIAGDWSLTLASDARILIAPPATFVVPSSPPLEGYVYATRGADLYTNLFARHFGHRCTGTGSYRWELVDARLTIHAIDDLCLERIAVLTTASWTRISDR